MASDPMLKALGDMRKNAPDKLKKDGKSFSLLSELEKAISGADKSYPEKLKSFLSALTADKKKLSKDKDAVKQIEAMTKIAKSDEEQRTKLKKVKGTMPS